MAIRVGGCPAIKSHLIDSDGYYAATNIEELAKEVYEALTANTPSWAISVGSIDVNSGGIANAGAISGATTLSMSGQLTNILAIGTPPFVITSTDVVANLNVDMVDGYNLDQGVLIASTPTFGGLTINGAMTLNGAITGVNSIACDLGTSINEFSIDGTLAGNSDDAVPTEKAIKTYVDGTVPSHNLASHSDVALTGAQLEDAVLHSGNTSWVSCHYTANSVAEAWDESTSMLTNPSTTNQYLVWHLPLPPVKGVLKLWVTGVRVGLYAANGTNYVDEMWVYGVKYTGRTYLTVSDRTVNKDSQGLHVYTMANFDCSGYECVAVEFLVALADVGALKISSVSLLCYYA